MVLRKHISIEEYDDGFQFSVNAGWNENHHLEDDNALGRAYIYMKCENGLCDNGSGLHFPPKWESYGEHENKHPLIFTIPEDMKEQLAKSRKQRDKERELPNIIKKYRKERDEAQIS